VKKLILILVLSLISSLTFGATWNTDANGSWNCAGNWCGGVPDSAGTTATFNCVITSDRTITINNAFKPDVGTLNIDDNNSYTIVGGNGGSSLEINGVGCSTAFININTSGNTSSHSINSKVHLWDDVDITVTAGVLTIGGVISEGGGSKNLDKLGAGTLIVSGNNNYTGTTIVSAGTLTLGASNVIADASDLEMNGGTFNTNNNDETMDVLTLSATSTIALGASNTLTLSDSSASAWSGAASLNITGWTGTAGLSGTAGQVFLPNDTSLTSTQLSQITFSGFASGAELLASGELVPAGVPETSTYIGSLLIMLITLVHRFRKKS
jgi:autotransporter-associated beta strand protein